MAEPTLRVRLRIVSVRVFAWGSISFRATALLLLLCVAVSCGGGENASVQKSAETSVVAEPTSVGTDAASAGVPANDATGGVLGSKCDKPGDTQTVNGIDLMCEKADGRNPVWMKNKYSSGSGNDASKNDGGDSSKNGDKKRGNYPDSADAPECPADISGILTAPMFKPEDLLFITPLGNVTPPGHTAPIDHQYITPSRGGKIPLYAPADGVIARMQTGGYSDDEGKTLQLDSFVFSLVVCRGLVLETTGNAAMEDLNPAIRALLPADPAQAPKDACIFGLHKVGHAHQWEWMCFFQRDLNVKVKAGDLLANLSSVPDRHGQGGFDFGVETWLANYNIEPPANGIHWDWYADDRYVHSICLFDKFSPDMNTAYAAKLGGYNPIGKGGMFYRMNAKDKDPICGVTVQDKPGTLRGFWFSAPDMASKFGESGPQYGDNAGISFIRNNSNPDVAQVVDGGGLVAGSAMISVVPQHSGTIDRDPVEVTPGTTVYCYNALGGIREMLGGKAIPGDHRFVVQLVDATNVKVDLQAGSCTGKETMTDKAITYIR